MRAYLLSFLFHTDDLSTRIQRSDEIFSGKRIQFLPSADAKHSPSLSFPAVWLAAHLVLAGCIYILLTRYDLKDVFSGLPSSLGKCPNTSHCCAVFLILQLAWKTDTGKLSVCFTLHFTGKTHVTLILARYKCLAFLLWQSFHSWKVGKKIWNSLTWAGVVFNQKYFKPLFSSVFKSWPDSWLLNKTAEELLDCTMM